jgi:hypothetical protein
MRSFRCVAGALLCCTAAALPATKAFAQTTTVGSSLTAAPNYPYHCDVRWMPGDGANNLGGWGPGGQQFWTPMPTGPTTCSLGMLGQQGKPATSTMVPGKGTVTVARVKSGPNPAPISIATVRSFEGRDQQGQLVNTCCQGVSETPVVTPKPNAVTEIPVGFLVDAYPFDPDTKKAGVWDYVVVNVHGTSGTLPIHDKGGLKPFGIGSTPPGDNHSFWHFPQIDPSQHNQNRFIADGFEVLVNFDWTACTQTAGAARAAQACSTQQQPPPAQDTGAGGQTTNTTTTTTAGRLASIRSSRLTMRRGTVKVSVKCLATTTCRGTARLKTTARKARTLARKSVRIRAGKTASVSLKLSRKNQRSIKRRGTRVAIEVDLGAGGKVTRRVTLKRR